MAAALSATDLKIRALRDGPLKRCMLSLRDGSGSAAHELRDVGISADHADAIARLLRRNASVTYLGMSGNRLYARAAERLADALAHNEGLTSLDLSGTSIGGYAEYGAFVPDSKGVSALLRSLVANRTLVALNLEGTRLGARGARVLADALAANRTLAWINVSNTGIGTSGAQLLAEALRGNPAVERLTLAFLPLAVQALKGREERGRGPAVGAAPGPAAADEFDFAGREVHPPDVVAVCALLRVHPTLRALSLRGAVVDSDGFRGVAALVAGARSLESLSLVDTDPTPEDAAALADACARCPSIRSVTLVAAALPVAALKGTEHRAAVRLPGCGLCAPDAAFCARLLETNHSVSEVDLRDNDIASSGNLAGLAMLADAVQRNERITALALGGNALGRAAAPHLTTIHSALRFNAMSGRLSELAETVRKQQRLIEAMAGALGIDAEDVEAGREVVSPRPRRPGGALLASARRFHRTCAAVQAALDALAGRRAALRAACADARAALGAVTAAEAALASALGRPDEQAAAAAVREARSALCDRALAASAEAAARVADAEAAALSAAADASGGGTAPHATADAISPLAAAAARLRARAASLAAEGLAFLRAEGGGERSTGGPDSDAGLAGEGDGGVAALRGAADALEVRYAAAAAAAASFGPWTGEQAAEIVRLLRAGASVVENVCHVAERPPQRGGPPSRGGGDDGGAASALLASVADGECSLSAQEVAAALAALSRAAPPAPAPLSASSRPALTAAFSRAVSLLEEGGCAQCVAESGGESQWGAGVAGVRTALAGAVDACARADPLPLCGGSVAASVAASVVRAAKVAQAWAGVTSAGTGRPEGDGGVATGDGKELSRLAAVACERVVAAVRQQEEEEEGRAGGGGALHRVQYGPALAAALQERNDAWRALASHLYASARRKRAAALTACQAPERVAEAARALAAVLQLAGEVREARSAARIATTASLLAEAVAAEAVAAGAPRSWADVEDGECGNALAVALREGSATLEVLHAHCRAGGSSSGGGGGGGGGGGADPLREDGGAEERELEAVHALLAASERASALPERVAEVRTALVRAQEREEGLRSAALAYADRYPTHDEGIMQREAEAEEATVEVVSLLSSLSRLQEEAAEAEGRLPEVRLLGLGNERA